MIHRELSSESVATTLSCITVGSNARGSSATRNSVANSDTPPTSIDEGLSKSDTYASGKARKEVVDDGIVQITSSEETRRRRSSRAGRSAVASYNLNALSGSHVHTPSAFRRGGSKTATRTISGATLVPEHADSKERLLNDALDLDWKLDTLPGDKPWTDDGLRKRNASRFAALKGNAKNALSATQSILGKRTRKAIEVGADKIQSLAGGRQEAKKSRLGANMGRRCTLRARIKDDPIEKISDEPPSKRIKTTGTTTKDTAEENKENENPKAPEPRKSRKLYLAKGLYAGQTRPVMKPSSIKRKKGLTEQPAEQQSIRENSVLPMPMFGGEKLLSIGRDFKLPWGIVQPLAKAVKVDGWTKISKNRAVGEAIAEWKKQKPKNQAHSICLCTPEDGCGVNCLNRGMFYECDRTNCSLGSELCKNRPFAELERRVKSNNLYDQGVEILKTVDKGHGVRTMRSFEYGQLIMEYTGEIINQDECDRRVNEDYKDSECYYLMMFNKLIIDATRGSMARFVNHSCEPNCKMDMWTVAGRPRMALFAERDIEVGEELTYDYNFEAFSSKWSQECKCGSTYCRGVLGPRGKEARESKETKPAPAAASSGLRGVKRKAADALEETLSRVSSKKARKPLKTARTQLAKLASGSFKKSQKSKPLSSASASIRSGRSSKTAVSLSVKNGTVLTVTAKKAGRKTSIGSNVGSAKSIITTKKTVLPSTQGRGASAIKKPLKRISAALKEKRVAALSSKISPKAKASSTSKRQTSATHLIPKKPGRISQSSSTPSPVKRHNVKAQSMRKKPIRPLARAAKGVMVRSVKGARRAEAMNKMGLTNSVAKKGGRTLRVVDAAEGDESENEQNYVNDDANADADLQEQLLEGQHLQRQGGLSLL